MIVINHFYGKKGDNTMKRIISTILAFILLLGCVFTLASCEKMLMGKYEAVLTDENKTTYEFTPFGVTKTTSIGAFGFAKTETVEGKYKIAENEDGKLEITFTWEDSDDTVTLPFSQGEEDGVKYVEIGLVRYNKAK